MLFFCDKYAYIVTSIGLCTCGSGTREYFVSVTKVILNNDHEATTFNCRLFVSH